jgi:Zn-dependent oligopeptidase
MGFDSYSAYQLDSFSLASRPAAVAAFLRRFAAAIAPKCADEAAELSRLKKLHSSSSGGDSGSEARPWDRAFLAAAAAEGGGADALGALPAYLELESVVEGLSQLLRRSMGVTLEERPLVAGEGWAPGVRKLAAVHDMGGWACGGGRGARGRHVALFSVQDSGRDARQACIWKARKGGRGVHDVPAVFRAEPGRHSWIGHTLRMHA